ncbi:MAG: signal peptidase I [Patescibacteria group bacterium]
MSKRLKESLKDFLKLGVITAVIFVLTNVFVGELMVISGSSMEPNFHDNEQILSEKISYRFTQPRRGQIVVVKHPTEKGRLIIKRIVGLPGETMLISHGQIFIDGTKLEEPYMPLEVDSEGRNAIPTGVNFKIPENSYVVLGDNREDSIDSREWGPINKNSIIGRTILVYYPLTEFRIVTF